MLTQEEISKQEISLYGPKIDVSTHEGAYYALETIKSAISADTSKLSDGEIIDMIDTYLQGLGV